jgi:hypothetical protein
MDPSWSTFWSGLNKVIFIFMRDDFRGLSESTGHDPPSQQNMVTLFNLSHLVLSVANRTSLPSFSFDPFRSAPHLLV